MARLLRHRQTKEAATDRPGLRDAESCSLLYPHHLLDCRVQQGRTGAVDSLMLVRSDPDEPVRTRALQ
jgi:hypothetical protein